jgi:selenide, water dikinase
MASPSSRVRLLLVGGGHAHVYLLDALTRAPIPGLELTVLSPFPHHHYSGMVPGYLAGQYGEPELRFDLEGMVKRAGGLWVQGWATGLRRGDLRHPDADGVVEGTSERGDLVLPFDLASIDVGSVPVGVEIPGVRAFARTVRPMSRAVELREALDAVLASRVSTLEDPVRVAVVGGGSAGFEVALALHRRIADQGCSPSVFLIERGPRILPDFSATFRARAMHILKSSGIEVLLDTSVRAVHADRVDLEADPVDLEGRSVPVDLVAWMTGAAPPPFLVASDLPRSPGDGRNGAPGFFLVDETLRSIDGAPVWGAGDCIALEGAPWMGRAGVYAVRQSPILEANLRSAAAARLGIPHPPPKTFRPQRSFLSLQNTADGRALLRWKGVVAHTRWAMRLKDRIDRGFMRRYEIA